ncbi:MAG: PAS domain S-box protein [Deltaproteobacteria bacterium]|nr:PAS domain S-box protein [Deltaproteobacteria bacterium]
MSSDEGHDDAQQEIERLRSELAEHKRALETLRDNEEKHKLLIETTNTGFVILDGEGRVIDSNQEYARLTGHEHPEELLGRKVLEWTAAYDRERNAAEVRKCLEAGSVRNLEIDYAGPGGQTIPVEVNATVVRTSESVSILTICRDISERRRAEEALRNSELRYRNTIDALSDLLHVVDSDLCVVLINAAGTRWMKSLGLTSDPLGRTVFEIFPFLPAQVRQEYQQVFETGRPWISQEANTIDGKQYVTETRKIPIEEGGKVVRVVTVVRDVTESVHAQQRLSQAEKMEALGQLAGGIAHDFNNQLAAMLGYAELLASRLENPELRDYAYVIARAAARSADLTRQLLAFSRKGPHRTVPVDVHNLIREVAALLERTIDKQITLRTRLAAVDAISIGDPAQLQNALLNLAINARDAMPHGGDLTFSTEVVTLAEEDCRSSPYPMAPGRYVRVSVEDTGSGMTEAVRRRLFEPFFTTKEPSKGTGMGLAAVYGTVLNHQGAIHVRSEPGMGSAFTVDLPVLESFDATDGRVEVEAPSRGTSHILLADDEMSVREMTAAALRHLGYRVTVCADGAQALACYRELWREVDLVILDMVMPNLSGREAFAAMRQLVPQAKCILVSGFGIDPQVQRLLDEGALGFIQKPFHINDLFGKVAAALRLSGP